MTLRKTTATLLFVICLFLLIGCTGTAVPQPTAVSQAVPSEQPATPTAVPATNTPLPDPTEPAPTATMEPTATLPPSPTPTPEIWQELAKMPSARSEMSAEVIDGRIYVPGGWGNGFDQSTALEVYDPATDSWETLAELPFHVNHHATAVYNNALYLFGPEGTALHYNPGTDTWEELAPMPEERWQGPLLPWVTFSTLLVAAVAVQTCYVTIPTPIAGPAWPHCCKRGSIPRQWL